MTTWNFNFKFNQFFFAPCTARPLGCLRIGIAAALIFQALSIAPELLELYGESGILQQRFLEFMQSGATFFPTFAWISKLLEPFGISYDSTVLGVFFLYLSSLTCLLIGWKTRSAALACWFLHFTLLSSEIFTNYGVDRYTHFVLFYFILFPVGHWGSLDAWGKEKQSTAFARAGLRVLQIHLCITYFGAGLGKAMGAQWWNGDAVWRSLMLPQYSQFDFSWMADFSWLPMLFGWGTLVLETLYPVFIWQRRTRLFWLLGILSLHLGIVFFMGLGVFGWVMIILNTSLFGISPEIEESMNPLGFRTIKKLSFSLGK